MEIEIINGQKIAIVGVETKLTDFDEIIDIMGNASYLGAIGLVVRKEQLPEGFFDLKTKIAGEILQKFSNYRMKMSIIGDFSAYTSKSLKDFIYECNKLGHITFTESMDHALNRITTS